jgi:hypothetical protein
MDTAAKMQVKRELVGTQHLARAAEEAAVSPGFVRTTGHGAAQAEKGRRDRGEGHSMRRVSPGRAHLRSFESSRNGPNRWVL